VIFRTHEADHIANPALVGQMVDGTVSDGGDGGMAQPDPITEFAKLDAHGCATGSPSNSGRRM
jgi:hypothetical protein